MAIKNDVTGGIMSYEALRQLRFSTLLRFAKASEIHITIPVSMGLRTGPELRSLHWVESSMMTEPSILKER